MTNEDEFSIANLAKNFGYGLFLMGMGAVTASGFIGTNHTNHRIKYVNHEGRKILVEHRYFGSDYLYVSDAKTSDTEFVPLERYLESIPDKYDQKIERAQIEKMVLQQVNK